jgi:gas vesicle protein
MLVMPESASIERRKIMQAYGAEILLTPGKRSTDGAIEQAYAMAREHPDRYFLTDQFNNDANWLAHVQTTGPEIWEQTGGQVTDVVATLGTTGTAMGLCKYFAEEHPEVRVSAVEPFLGHKIQGLKNMKESYKPGIFNKTLPYSIINIPDEEAFRHVRLLARKEGIFAGMSAGAAMCAALALAEQLDSGVIVVILADSGDKFFKGFVFGGLIGAAIGLLFAPKPGRVMREELGTELDKIFDFTRDDLENAKKAAKKTYEESKDRIIEKLITKTTDVQQNNEDITDTTSGAETKTAKKSKRKPKSGSE